MSHEIRTPMNGMLGFAELLARTDLDDSQRYKVDVIVSSGASMMKLLNDILDVSKIEIGGIKITSESVDLRDLLADCITLNSAQAGKKKLALEMEVTPDVPAMIAADPLRLRQVILNLTGNAIKFTERGNVLISASVEQGRLLIAVRDTGVGVPLDRLEAIFLPFEQADSTTSRRFGGTGLGLSISHQLAELMGGSLTVESTPGRGSTFTLALPLVVDAASSGSPAKQAEPRIALPRNGGTRRVLLAEDHEVNRELVREMLGELGYNVEMAVDGNEAIDKTLKARGEGTPYDLVLMDIQMPHCDGYEATRAIRAAGITEWDLPIVAITANAYPEDIEAAHDAGMQGHLAKPLSLSRLDRLIGITLGRTQTKKGDLRSNPRLAEMWTANCNNAGAAIEQFLDTSRPSQELQTACKTHAHQLAGTAARFGATELGRIAASVDQAMNSNTSDSELRELMREFLGQIKCADRRKHNA